MKIHEKIVSDLMENYFTNVNDTVWEITEKEFNSLVWNFFNSKEYLKLISLNDYHEIMKLLKSKTKKNG